MVRSMVLHSLLLVSNKFAAFLPGCSQGMSESQRTDSRGLSDVNVVGKGRHL